MYSKNLVLQALHIKSKRFLTVNLDWGLLTYHKTLDPKDRDPRDELPLCRIKSIDADCTHANKGKYYLKIITDAMEYKFKFKNSADFRLIVDSLGNCLYKTQPVYIPSTTYKTYASTYTTSVMPTAYHQFTNKDLNSSISSDDAHDYELQHKERDAVKKAKKIEKANYELEKDLAKADVKLSKDIACANKELTKDAYKQLHEKSADDADTKEDALKLAYKAEKHNLEHQYDAQKDYLKHTDAPRDAKGALKDEYKAEKKNLDAQFDSQKDAIKNNEKFANDVNKAAYDTNKTGIDAQYEANKHNIEARY